MGPVPAGSFGLGAGIPESGDVPSVAKQLQECLSRDCPYRREGDWPGIRNADNPGSVCWECRLHRLRSNPERERADLSRSNRTFVPSDNWVANHVPGTGVPGRDLEALSETGFPLRRQV